jgi:hypothetical protein
LERIAMDLGVEQLRHERECACDETVLQIGQLGLNSPSHNNFQSEWGVSLEPIVYKFRTRAAE